MKQPSRWIKLSIEGSAVEEVVLWIVILMVQTSCGLCMLVWMESNLEEMKSYGFLLTVLSRQTDAGLYFDYRNILD